MRDVIGNHLVTRMVYLDERATDIEIVPIHRQGIDSAVHPRTEGRPGAAVPLGDASRAHAPRRGEAAAAIEVASHHRQGIDSAVYPSAEGRPSTAVPLGNTVGAHAPRRGEVAAAIEVAPHHR